MKVVLVNTKTPGGAYVACQRLAKALQKQGVEVSLVEIKATKWHFLWERFCIWVANRFSRKNLFAVSIANTGTDISKLPEVQAADIIHLHWINQGGLSLNNIAQLQSLGKPIVWTMHDMWSFTGICHHAYGCIRYCKECGSCHLLSKPSANDISYQTHRMKERLYSPDIHFVSVSKWLHDKAAGSPLVNSVTTIPNGLDTSVFTIQDKQRARQYYALPADKKIVLMGAGRLNDPIKGFNYLREALSLLDNKDEVCLCLFGNIKKEPDFLADLPVQVVWLHRPFTPQELALLYSAADVTVAPSLYETFGQTLSESLACGTPVVSFDNSGQTDIIVHRKNGYLAKWRDSKDLAEGIGFVLSHSFDAQTLNAYAVEHFSETVVAQQYCELYESILTR